MKIKLNNEFIYSNNIQFSFKKQQLDLLAYLD